MRSLRLGVWKSTLHDFYLYSLFLSFLLSSFFWPIGYRMYAKLVYLCLVFTLFHLQAIVAYTKTIEVCVDLVVRSFVRLFDSVACIVSFFITHWHILVCTKRTHISETKYFRIRLIQHVTTCPFWTRSALRITKRFIWYERCLHGSAARGNSPCIHTVHIRLISFTFEHSVDVNSLLRQDCKCSCKLCP